MTSFDECRHPTTLPTQPDLSLFTFPFDLSTKSLPMMKKRHQYATLVHPLPMPPLRRRLAICALSFSMLCATTSALAHGDPMSQASALSALPLAMSVAAPAMLVAGASAMTVVAVSVVAEGTVWVLQRASDGARIVLKMSAVTAAMASVAVGTAVTVTAVSAGWVLSAAGEALALLPNELGRALLHHERVMQ
jgi:hypothetical protein